jgi:hypothetical protein
MQQHSLLTANFFQHPAINNHTINTKLLLAAIVLIFPVLFLAYNLFIVERMTYQFLYSL